MMYDGSGDVLIRIRSAILEKTVPKHRHSVWYYVGGLTALAFGIQFVTGILLLYYFSAEAGESAKSLELIVRHVPFGWYVRSLHSWSASLAILLTIVHLVSAFILAAYRGRGRVLWVSGVPLLLLMLAFGYTGSLLPQSQGSTLRLFYMLHVEILPIAGVVLVGAHLFFSLVIGNNVPNGIRVQSSRRFFPDFVLSEIIVWLVALAVLLVVAWYLPWEFNGSFFAPKDAPMLNVPSNWYLLWQKGWLSNLPSLIYWAVIIVALVLIALVPKLDRTRAKLVRNLGIIALLALIVISCLAYFSSPDDFTTSAISTAQPGGASITAVTPLNK